MKTTIAANGAVLEHIFIHVGTVDNTVGETMLLYSRYSVRFLDVIVYVDGLLVYHLPYRTIRELIL